MALPVGAAAGVLLLGAGGQAAVALLVLLALLSGVQGLRTD
ncbi:MAG: hypothetical protein ACRDT4_23085 [Micromonosporaceae bacterium]